MLTLLGTFPALNGYWSNIVTAIPAAASANIVLIGDRQFDLTTGTGTPALTDQGRQIRGGERYSISQPNIWVRGSANISVYLDSVAELPNADLGLLDGRYATTANTVSSLSLARTQRLIRLRSAAAVAALNNPVDLSVMASPPTITLGTAATGALTNIYTFTTNPSVFRTSNGIPTQRVDIPANTVFPITKVGNATTAAGNLTGSNWTTDNQDQLSYWDVTFQSDADTIEFKLNANTAAGAGYRFIVNGQYVSFSFSDMSVAGGAAAGTKWIKLTFGSRAVRNITIEGSGLAGQFISVAVGPTSSIWYPSDITETVAIWSGDSFMESTQGGTDVTNFGLLGMGARLRYRLGITRAYNLAIGSTGYYNTGSNNRRCQYQQIANDWSRTGAPWTDPDIVVFANGYNDYPGASTSAAVNGLNSVTNGTTVPVALAQTATAAWVAARALYPNALFVVTGGFGGKRGPDADTIAGEGYLRAAFNAWADPFSVYIPINVDPTVTGFVPYQSGTGYYGATTGTGNSDVTTSQDATHPSNYGHDLIARRLSSDIRRAIARMTA